MNPIDMEGRPTGPCESPLNSTRMHVWQQGRMFITCAHCKTRYDTWLTRKSRSLIQQSQTPPNTGDTLNVRRNNY
jgi:hypothetical protein